MNRFIFTPENRERIEALFGRYPEKKACVLPGLWVIQEQEGHISAEAMEALAGLLDLAPMEVYRVATFYTMFRLDGPAGATHIEVCKTLSCMLCGKEELLEHIQERLKIRPGQTTADGLYSLELVECMGACGGGPMIALNGVYHEGMTPEKFDHLIGEGA